MGLPIRGLKGFHTTVFDTVAASFRIFSKEQELSGTYLCDDLWQGQVLESQNHDQLTITESRFLRNLRPTDGTARLSHSELCNLPSFRDF